MVEPIPYPLYFLIIPIGLRLTCYYFRGWAEESVLRRSFKKLFNWQIISPNFINNILLKNFNVDMIHRYFLILSVPLIVVHLSISLYHTLIVPSAWVQLDSLTHLSTVYKSLVQPNIWLPHLATFNIFEWIDSIFLTLYVASCHVTRYFCGSGEKCTCKKQRLLGKQTVLNNYHGSIFWISLFTLLQLLCN